MPDYFTLLYSKFKQPGGAIVGAIPGNIHQALPHQLWHSVFYVEIYFGPLMHFRTSRQGFEELGFEKNEKG